MIKYNTKGYKIETPLGYMDFKGISYNGKKEIWKVTVENGFYIEASQDHTFYINEEKRKLKDLQVGWKLNTTEGLQTIKSIDNTGVEEETYDIIHVDNTKHTFFANGIETSNCKFLGSAPTLVDPDILEALGSTTVRDATELKYNGALKVFETPKDDAMYIMGVDSASGNGGDYSVVQVLKLTTEYEIEQVAVFRSNTMSYAMYSEACIGISKYYNECFMLVENNDIGSNVANMIWNDYEYDNILNTDGMGKPIGTRATKKSKLDANMLLKRFMENSWLTIRDELTLKELSQYEEVTPNVFKGPRSGHDDCVTALLWALYFVSTPFFDAKDLSVKSIDAKFLLSQKIEEEYTPVVLFDNDKPKVDGYGFTWD